MKKEPSAVKSILVLIASLILMTGCKVDNNKNDYLRKVLKNLDQIKSATYISNRSISQPYDTLKYRTYINYTKEFSNPTDTFIGASYIRLQSEDTNKMDIFYDGKFKAYLNWAEKTILIDSFKKSIVPFRPVSPPFFSYTKSIIKYALETSDSITTSLKDFGDSIQFSLFIYDKSIEFFGKAFVYGDPNIPSKGEITRYDIWIHKSDDLPYQERRKMPHETSWESCSEVKINKNNNEVLLATKYFPSDFTFEYKGKGKGKAVINDLEGKVAPDWILKDADNKTIALKELKSKVLMIQFTGVGCGACHAAIPFLKQLVTDYKDKDFEFISIECWDTKSDGIKRYQDKNSFNFKFLLSTKAVTESYHIQPVPEFLILDKDRVIRKVIIGYSKGQTDKEIRDAINKLI